MSSNWKKYKLGDISYLRRDNISPLKFNGENYIGLEHIGQGTFLLDGLGSAEEVTSNKSVFLAQDILYGKIRPYFKKVYKPNFSGICSTDIMVFRTKDENVTVQDYLYNILRTQEFTDKATETSTGTKMPRADWKSLSKYEISLPSILEQTAIAEILSSLDDKIELNIQTNKTLEEMANALYKHWFVDFGPFKDGKFFKSDLQLIPEGWEIKIFSELYDLRKGLSYRSKDYDDDGIPMINLKCVDRNGGFRYDGIKYYKGEYKSQHIVEAGDLLIAMTDLTQDRSVLGSPLFAPNIKTKSHVIASLDISILKQIDKNLPNLNLYFYYLMRTPKYHEYILGFGNGSTVVHLDKLGIVNYKALLPSANVIEQFNSHVSVIRNSIELNIEENISLKQTRDYLLPKLISGEIRVKEASKKVKEVL